MNIDGSGQSGLPATNTPVSGAVRQTELQRRNNQRQQSPHEGVVNVARLPGAQPLNASGRGQYINLVV